MNRFGLAVGVFAALVLPGLARAQDRVIPFTTWQAEQQAVVKGLPCKWVSLQGKYAGGRYDFLCKGGTWATVSLFMDKSRAVSDGVGEVRLQYIEWNPKVHPNAGEAFTAQKFLSFVVDRFVPASAAAEVLEAFWGESGKTWSGGGVGVRYSFEEQRDFNIHRLTVGGEGKVLSETGMGAGPARRMEAVTPSDAGLLKAPAGEVQWSAPPAVPAGPVKWTPGSADVAPVTLPVPTVGGGEDRVPHIAVPPALPVASQDSSTLERAKAALREAIGAKAPAPLETANPAELNTMPAPESLQKAAPPPAVSPTLVPDASEIDNGPKAPSNFDAYNKATELTRDIEKKANTQAILPSKVKPADEAQRMLAVTPTVPKTAPMPQPGPTLAPTPTPGVDNGPNTDATVPGTARPVRLSPEELESGGLGTYDPMNPARSKEIRPLPQLKFIPKAEPVRGGEVIQFEDEGSKL